MVLAGTANIGVLAFSRGRLSGDTSLTPTQRAGNATELEVAPSTVQRTRQHATSKAFGLTVGNPGHNPSIPWDCVRANLPAIRGGVGSEPQVMDERALMGE